MHAAGDESSRTIGRHPLWSQAPLPLVLFSAFERWKMLTAISDGLCLVWRNDHCFLGFLSIFSPFNSQYHFSEKPLGGINLTEIILMVKFFVTHSSMDF